jgi:hypothetical protein
MFDVKPDSRMTIEEQLLYNIWQELKGKAVETPIIGNPLHDVEFVMFKEPVKTNKPCKHCGQPHEKPVDYAQCARKHKAV